MTQPPFGMDPAARFDEEVARIARENDADVVFQLVEREDPAMDSPAVPPRCQLHNDTPVRRPERYYEFTITEKNQPEEEKLVTCFEHGEWVSAGKPEAKPPEPSNPKEVEKVRAQMVDQNVTISRGKRIKEAPGLDKSLGLEPPHRPPPEPRPDPPYQSPLVVRCLGRLARPCLSSCVQLSLPDARRRKRIVELVGVIDLVLEVFGVVHMAYALGGPADKQDFRSLPGIA